MDKFIIVSYATENTPYEEVYESYLKESINKINPTIYNFHAKVPSLGNWYKNTAYKGKFVLDCLNEFKDSFEMIVLLDVDAKILQYPKLFEEIPQEYDIGCHFLDWKTWYGQKDSKVKELLTGTMFFRNNPNVRALCEDWYNTSNKTSEWEQKVLQDILPKHNIKVYELPLDYCYINSRPRELPPLVKIENPVIVHYQKSRELKRRINEGR